MRINKKHKQKIAYIKPAIDEQNISLNFFFQNFDSTSVNEFPDFHGEGWALLAAGTKGSCFPPTMRVVMSDRTLKEIQKTREGDHVLSFDYKKKLFTESTITSVLKYDQSKEELIIINDKLEVTIGHPLYVNGDIVKHAGKLRLGDELLGTNQQIIRVASLKYTKPISQPILYNLKLGGTINNYFVENILVFTGHKV